MKASFQRYEKIKPFRFAERLFHLSGWQDSNLRPSGPKPDALTGLRYTPKLEAQKYYKFSDFIIYPVNFDIFSLLSTKQLHFTAIIILFIYRPYSLT
jgi:hypothetical protein